MPAYNFTKALTDVKAKRQNFLFFVDGKENRLLVAPSAIPADWIKDAKAECGGTQIKGTCYFDPATKQLTFVTRDKPKEAWEVKVGKMAKAAKYMHPVTFRQLREGDPEDAGHEEVPPAPPLPTPTTPPSNKEAPEVKTTPQPSRGVAYAQMLLKWNGARQKVKGQLQQLEKAILADFAQEQTLPDVQQRVGMGLDDILDGLDERLTDLLDDAISVPVEERAELNKEALAIIKEYGESLTDPDKAQLIAKLKDNAYKVPVTVQETLGGALTELAKGLQK
ncbi:hypothetical protein AYO44_05430 [Planctomycetaceae bacterium SCGC AG-212-F19]|nr:hypothetical protein AYO44_05430 [Planctomycetaceae bacterium SCGC AG-212-F19]